MKLNLGSGLDIMKDYINMDKSALLGVNVVHDLNIYPYPFTDNIFDEVIAFAILEHLIDWNKAMEEIWRIAKPGAIIYIKVPFFPSMYAFMDPTHKSCFTYYTFDYYDPDHDLGKYYFKAKFKVIEKYIRFSWNKFINFIPAFFINLTPRFYSRYLAFIFPSNMLEVKLQVIK